MDLPALLGQVLLLCGLAVTGVVLARVIRLEYAVVCVVCGFGFGQILPWLAIDTGIRASNFADIIFFLLLPPLIFEAGWQLDPRQLRRWVSLALTLAIFGLIIATLAGAALLFFGINHSAGFPVIAALLTACLLAPTDPGTVISQLRKNNAPDDLAVVMESESLFNDASAVVLFSVILGFALGNQPGLHQVSAALLSFGLKFCGGLLLGLAVGGVTVLLLKLATDTATRVVILVLTIFTTFYLGESLAHVSGVMAVLSCALLTRRFAALPAVQQTGAETTFGWLGLLSNALLFTLMGLAFEPDMLTERWLAMGLGVVAALLARTMAVYLSLALSRLSGAPGLELKYAPLLVAGGLRGAVTIALALSLPTELDYWWTIQAIAFGVVLCNLFVQSPANALLLRHILGKQASPR